MKVTNVLNKQATRFILLAVFAAALAAELVVASPQPARADQVTPPPPVPDNLKVPEGNKLFLVGHAIGTQNYICLPSGAGFAFKLFTPQATLFDDNKGQLITHFFSPNPNPDPAENGIIRATWEDSRDTSKVWAATPKNPDNTDPFTTDSKFVEQGAVAWVKLTAVGTEKGPTGGDRLTVTTFVQRLNTHGGLAPSTGCASLSDVGKKAFQPYRADYFFYKKDGN